MKSVIVLFSHVLLSPLDGTGIKAGLDKCPNYI